MIRLEEVWRCIESGQQCIITDYDTNVVLHTGSLCDYSRVELQFMNVASISAVEDVLLIGVYKWKK